jgi:hypothetical protein
LHYDTLVKEGRWKELEVVLDGEAYARGRPRCTKKSSAIRQHLEDMDMLKIVAKALTEDVSTRIARNTARFLRVIE